MNILVSAGELSGDAIGAGLAASLMAANGSRVAGAAGPKMVAAGVHALADASHFSHAGWTSVAAALPALAFRAWKYFLAVDRFAPDLAVVVDAPGLHTPLLRRLQRRGIPVAWVAPPQVWAWKRRTRPILSGLSVYPAHQFEVESLVAAGARPNWWGFPGERPQVIGGDRRQLAVFPGSRIAWRKRHRELFVEAANLTQLGLETVLVHPTLTGREAGIACQNSASALRHAALAISLPGTATLECAWWRVPTVVAARPGVVDTLLARRHLAPGFRALPNRILAHPVFPELFGPEVTAPALARALVELFERRQEVELQLAGFEVAMGAVDAVAQIAAHILATKAGGP